MSLAQLDSFPIITVKAESSGVPEKNRHLVVPTIRKTIDAMGACYVSTNCPYIAKICEQENAEIVDRSKASCADGVGPQIAIREAIDQHNVTCPIVLVQVTAPLLKPAEIIRCFASYLISTADMALLVSPYTGVVFDEHMRPITFSPHSDNVNRQHRKPMWECTGGVFVFRPSYLDQPWMSGDLLGVPVSDTRLEIDTQRDLLELAAVE